MSSDNLQPGDVLSYSAGSSQAGPDGYRRQSGGGNVMDAMAQRWPEIPRALGERPPLLINAYPASLGTFPFGILVDSYLSPKTVSRALQLAAREELPAIVMSQPLILVDVLLHHLAGPGATPDTLLLVLGGYVMPQSLETMLRDALAGVCEDVFIVHAYGVAAVDAACLLASERDAAGRLIYYRRSEDVIVESDDGQLVIGLRPGDDRPEQVSHATGDGVGACGEGYVITPAPERGSLETLALFESWSSDEWRRRTGFIAREPALRIQLRDGIAPNTPAELGFYDFGAAFGFSWLNKPNWK